MGTVHKPNYKHITCSTVASQYVIIISILVEPSA